jgi:hypothetical protein
MMREINKYIFYTICDKNIDLYDEIILTFKKEYNSILFELKNTIDCKEVRILIHKLIGLINNINNKNAELNYIVKSMLGIPKETTDFDYYRDYIYLLLCFDKSQIV